MVCCPQEPFTVPKIQKVTSRHDPISSVKMSLQTLFNVLQQVGCILYTCACKCTCMNNHVHSAPQSTEREREQRRKKKNHMLWNPQQSQQLRKYSFVCVYIHVCERVHVCVHVFVCVHLCLCMYVCVHVRCNPSAFTISRVGWCHLSGQRSEKHFVQLAEHLYKYAKYLEEQNEKVLALQHISGPAPSVTDAISLYTLPIQDTQSQSKKSTTSSQEMPLFLQVIMKRRLMNVYNKHLSPKMQK